MGIIETDIINERRLQMVQRDHQKKSNAFMSVPEAAKYLGIGRKVVYDLIDWGELGAIRENGAIRVDRNSVRAFQESGKRP